MDRGSRGFRGTSITLFVYMIILDCRLGALTVASASASALVGGFWLGYWVCLLLLGRCESWGFWVDARFYYL